MRRTRELLVLLLPLLTAVPISADVSIAGTLVFPKPPMQLPVFDTATDDSLADKMTGRLKAGRHVATSAAGETSFFRRTANGAVPAIAPDPDIDRGVAKAFFESVLPADETARKIGPRFETVLQKFHADGRVDNVESESSIVRIERYIAFEDREYRVYGEGSTAVAEVFDENVRSAVVRWKRVSRKELVATRPLTDEMIVEAVNAQFPDADYRVSFADTPELAYYDDQTRIVPVYRVTVTIHPRGAGHADQEELFIPATAIAPRTRVVQPGDAIQPCDVPSEAPQDPRSLSVDRYVFVGDLDVWVMNARAFLAGLPQPPFTARNFCGIERRMLAADPGYIDGANVVLIEAHGEPGCIITAGQCVDLSPYGAQSDGLQLLILHSCNVIRTSDDARNNWSARWWTVFRGLHTVVGYRNTISRSDNVSIHYARHLANDDPMIRAWLMEAAAPRGTSNRSIGRPSAITVCGHGDDVRSQLATIPTPDCLVAYWLR